MTLISDLLSRYEDYLTHERALADATRYAYLRDLRLLADFTPFAVEHVDRDELRAYMRYMSQKGYAPATIRRTFHGFGTFWAWLKLEGIVGELATENLNLPRLNRTAPRWLSEDELRRFAYSEVRRRDNRLVLRDALAWKVLAWLGLRRQELLGLQLKDVHLVDQVVVIRNTKSKQDRALAIPDELLCDFEQLCDGRAGEDYVFGLYGRPWGIQPFARAFKRQLANAGLAGRGITPHTLRHSFATHLVMRGVPLHVVQALLGHKEMSSTAKYLHTDPARLKDALAKHPLHERNGA